MSKERNLLEVQERSPEIFRLWKRGESVRTISRMTGVCRPAITRMVATVESFDPTTPAGEAMLGILSVFAELDYRMTSIRASETKKLRATELKNGKRK